MRYLNCWDNKNFFGAKSGPLTHASSVNNNQRPSNLIYFTVDLNMFLSENEKGIKFQDSTDGSISTKKNKMII